LLSLDCRGEEGNSIGSLPSLQVFEEEMSAPKTSKSVEAMDKDEDESGDDEDGMDDEYGLSSSCLCICLMEIFVVVLLGLFRAMMMTKWSLATLRTAMTWMARVKWKRWRMKIPGRRMASPRDRRRRGGMLPRTDFSPCPRWSPL